MRPRLAPAHVEPGQQRQRIRARFRTIDQHEIAKRTERPLRIFLETTAFAHAEPRRRRILAHFGADMRAVGKHGHRQLAPGGIAHRLILEIRLHRLVLRLL